ncbi:MAG: enhanced serine sensitivity protein SseB C-terminal domain-containing protein [Deltaproteobacteria bacterium]|nr:enhanced serine sensitivity protein SseB C-terminal domain-containing protein [Deltaproteobacteria bacterium]
MGWLDKLRGKRSPGAQHLEPMMRALAAGGDEATRREFYEALLRARLIVPSPGLAPGGPAVDAEHRLEHGATINILGTEAPDGSRGMIVLTSEAALLAWRPVGCPYVELGARDVFTMALGSGFGSVVVNPCGPSGGLIPQGELQALAEGRLPKMPVQRVRIEKGTRMALGMPVRPIPPALLETGRAQAEARPEVRAAWVLQLAVGVEAPHLCVVLEHEAGANPEEFVPPLMAAVQAVLPAGDCVDCIPSPPGGVEVAMAREAAPAVFTRG